MRKWQAGLELEGSWGLCTSDDQIQCPMDADPIYNGIGVVEWERPCSSVRFALFLPVAGLTKRGEKYGELGARSPGHVQDQQTY